MIKTLGGAVLIGGALALSGCGGAGPATPAPAAAPAASATTSSAAGDTAAVCERWKAAQLPYLLSTAPEAKAYAQAVADSYQGKEIAGAAEIQRKFWSGWADAIRPLVAQAEEPELQKELAGQVAELDRRAAAGKVDLTQQPLPPAQHLCLRG
jgi:hypothetical protein